MLSSKSATATAAFKNVCQVDNSVGRAEALDTLYADLDQRSAIPLFSPTEQLPVHITDAQTANQVLSVSGPQGMHAAPLAFGHTNCQHVQLLEQQQEPSPAQPVTGKHSCSGRVGRNNEPSQATTGLNSAVYCPMHILEVPLLQQQSGHKPSFQPGQQYDLAAGPIRTVSAPAQLTCSLLQRQADTTSDGAAAAARIGNHSKQQFLQEAQHEIQQRLYTVVWPVLQAAAAAPATATAPVQQSHGLQQTSGDGNVLSTSAPAAVEPCRAVAATVAQKQSPDQCTPAITPQQLASTVPACDTTAGGTSDSSVQVPELVAQAAVLLQVAAAATEALARLAVQAAGSCSSGKVSSCSVTAFDHTAVSDNAGHSAGCNAIVANGIAGSNLNGQFTISSDSSSSNYSSSNSAVSPQQASVHSAKTPAPPKQNPTGRTAIASYHRAPRRHRSYTCSQQFDLVRSSATEAPGYRHSMPGCQEARSARVGRCRRASDVVSSKNISAAMLPGFQASLQQHNDQVQLLHDSNTGMWPLPSIGRSTSDPRGADSISMLLCQPITRGNSGVSGTNPPGLQALSVPTQSSSLSNNSRSDGPVCSSSIAGNDLSSGQGVQQQQQQLWRSSQLLVQQPTQQQQQQDKQQQQQQPPKSPSPVRIPAPPSQPRTCVGASKALFSPRIASAHVRLMASPSSAATPAAQWSKVAGEGTSAAGTAGVMPLPPAAMQNTSGRRRSGGAATEPKVASPRKFCSCSNLPGLLQQQPI